MYHKEKRIPTILAIMLILLGIGSTTFLDGSVKSLMSKASNNIKLENIRISNVTDNSFVVSFFTLDPLSGSLEIRGGNMKKTLFDDLDSDNVPKKRTIHYITVSNLSENLSYQIKINNDSINCVTCPVILQKTATRLNTPLELPPIIGSLVTSDGKPAVGAVVYLNVGNSLTLSVRTDTAGLYVVPLNNLRAQNLIDRPNISDSDLVQIEIISSTKIKSSGVIDFKSIRTNPNIPDMKLGETYNFLELLSKTNSLAMSQNNKVLGINTKIILTPTTLPEVNKNKQPAVSKMDLLFPKNDKDLTPDSKPSIKGMGIPGSQLTITINSSPQSATIIIGENGIWTFRPQKPLEAGIHTVTIQGVDTNGKATTIKRTFTVLKSGERVLGDSTPSASLTPVVTATRTPTPAQNITPSVAPTKTPIATQVPTNTRAPVPTNTTAPVPTNSQTVTPRTGDVRPLLLIGGVSVVLLSLGLKFFFFP
jgi:hypothetical protein